MSAEKVEEDLAERLWSHAGEHIAEVGPTGTGKTNGLYFNVEKIRTYNPREKIIWFDTGKSSEPAVLATMSPITFHIPEGCRIEISEVAGNKFQMYDYKVEYFKKWRNLWMNIKGTPADRINVVSFEPYVESGRQYVKAVNGIFNSKRYSGGLLDLVKRYEVEGPMALFMDEFTDIAPSRPNEMEKGHFEAAGKLQFSIRRFRSDGIRLVTAMQGWSDIRAGIRKMFQWTMPRQGAIFTKDRVSRFNPLWAKLQINQTAYVDRRNMWQAVLDLPFYGDGRAIWKIRYPGYLGINKLSEETGDENVLDDPTAGPYGDDTREVEEEEGELDETS